MVLEYVVIKLVVVTCHVAMCHMTPSLFAIHWLQDNPYFNVGQQWWTMWSTLNQVFSAMIDFMALRMLTSVGSS